MVEIGGKPILWHIMKIYSYYGICDFIICLGYKGYVIKEYFLNYSVHTSNLTINLRSGDLKVHQQNAEPWNVTLIDTGDTTQTGGRLKRVREYLDEEIFFLTYGDGVGNIDIKAVLDYHRGQGATATVTAVQAPSRFGSITLQDNRVTSFEEKPSGETSWINGGFFVLSQAVFNYIENDETIWERSPMETLARDKSLAAYKHSGFWQPMDTLRDKLFLEDLWKSGNAPWKVW
jgi:glucose-1-phosphate cytidylyltransferase